MRIATAAVILLSLSTGALGETHQLAGQWVNVDTDNRGLTRIDIYEQEGGWKIRAWAPAGDAEHDLGQATLAVLGDSVSCFQCSDPSVTSLSIATNISAQKNERTSLGSPAMSYGFAHWEYAFKDTYLTVRRHKDILVVEDFNIFKDGSGRTNYRSICKFKNAK
jgi:hypothetical protein